MLTEKDLKTPKRLDRRESLGKRGFSLEAAKPLNASNVESKSGKILAKVKVENPFFEHDVYAPYAPIPPKTKLSNRSKSVNDENEISTTIASVASVASVASCSSSISSSSESKTKSSPNKRIGSRLHRNTKSIDDHIQCE